MRPGSLYSCFSSLTVVTTACLQLRCLIKAHTLLNSLTSTMAELTVKSFLKEELEGFIPPPHSCETWRNIITPLPNLTEICQ